MKEGNRLARNDRPMILFLSFFAAVSGFCLVAAAFIFAVRHAFRGKL